MNTMVDSLLMYIAWRVTEIATETDLPLFKWATILVLVLDLIHQIIGWIK